MTGMTETKKTTYVELCADLQQAAEQLDWMDTIVTNDVIVITRFVSPKDEEETRYFVAQLLRLDFKLSKHTIEDRNYYNFTWEAPNKLVKVSIFVSKSKLAAKVEKKEVEVTTWPTVDNILRQYGILKEVSE